MKAPYKVVDLFAGPGGLAEGFSSVTADGKRLFEVALSVEMEPAAHKTLTLRSFTRQFPYRILPDEYYSFVSGELALEGLQDAYPQEWLAAAKEALRLELGTKEAAKKILPRVDEVRSQSNGRTILIGGPPCQAYSLVGRARNAGNEAYVAEDDGRHFLYREYIRILDRLRPAAFVMENVKGILSSSVAGGYIFERILDDLENVGADNGGYRLVALTSPMALSGRSPNVSSASDFIVRAEAHGVPQARHRVFVVGLRADVAEASTFSSAQCLLPENDRVSVRTVIGNLPRLRSGLSRKDDEQDWRETVLGSTDELIELASRSEPPTALMGMKRKLKSVRSSLSRRNAPMERIADEYDPRGYSDGLPIELASFLVDPRLPQLAHHESRGHMSRDLARYLFCAAYAEKKGRCAKASEFPDELAPNHQSWKSGKFADRFRVQTWETPSTTITSHISKDGHYYIHPDPAQCRSLTVREAARLQTFPDNYVFLGNRTQQYVQVGNAVPPYLAKQIAEALAKLLD
ncbi:DNA cytosine methyltransferase [uncultured Litoreibacter sp.]|uniref:DNA cytosine methyltransferase n=1 Tax=uncultured Litoreibacter sp. TaxID=1392394 RepID=UPI0026041AA8|nr:DNA cytosine methyltransferase [uncultured Litoreibacter sp.]